MPRTTGHYRITGYDGEQVRAFVPAPLPPADPPLVVEGSLSRAHDAALGALGRLALTGAMVPSTEWFLYGFVRKEAVISSQIEGTQATLRDVAVFEATAQSELPEDVEEVCNYVDALAWARREIARPKGLPLSTRLLCGAHKRLMRGVRGSEKRPGEIRTSQNWIGGSRPGAARFVPPPPELVPECMAALERWIHGEDPLPPLVRAGIAHVQFETIHPFLDGNGRIGRLLITLLLEHWRLLDAPLLYLSLAFKRRQREYYDRLSGVRTEGDWEGWTLFFLECAAESAEDGVRITRAVHGIVSDDRARVLAGAGVSVAALRMLELLPSHPVVTLQRVTDLLDTTKPTATKIIGALVDAGVLREQTGRRRDRVYSYHRYLEALTSEEPGPDRE